MSSNEVPAVQGDGTEPTSAPDGDAAPTEITEPLQKRRRLAKPSEPVAISPEVEDGSSSFFLRYMECNMDEFVHFAGVLLPQETEYDTLEAVQEAFVEKFNERFEGWQGMAWLSDYPTHPVYQFFPPDALTDDSADFDSGYIYDLDFFQLWWFYNSVMRESAGCFVFLDIVDANHEVWTPPVTIEELLDEQFEEDLWILNTNNKGEIN